MEYDKQIEIKIDGNNCIINIPSDQNLSSKSLNKILSQNNNSLTNIDDISFSVSLTEENMNSRNNFYNQNYENNKNNNYSNKKSNLYSNEKSKLEITYQSIFYSDLKSDSSNMKTPLLLLNYKNNIETQQKKDSVVKRLNFDLSNSNNSNNNTNNSNTFNYNNSNSNSNSNKNKNKTTTNNKNNINENFDINKINSEIQTVNIKKLPLISRNNIVKNISKNLNKEYFIHEKIYSSNKNNEKEIRNIERIKLDKKMKENSIKNSNKSRTNIINKSYANTNINEMPSINNRHITENYISKIKNNIFKNKNKENNNNNTNNNNEKTTKQLLLYKCSSKPNISNMRSKLNNMLKLNSKIEKENLNINSNTNYNKKENDININMTNNSNEDETIQKIKKNNKNMCIQIEKGKEKEKEAKKIYPRISSANIFNSSMKSNSLKSYNSYNQSAKINKLKKNNINNNNINNQNLKTPSLLNKQIILCTPQTNTNSCSTSYSAQNNKSPGSKSKNFENKSSDIKIENNKILKKLKNDPILSKVDAHKSLLKNFFLNPNNFKKQEKSDEFLTTNNNISNNNETEKKYVNDCLDMSINNKMSLRKFNTDLKIPLKKAKQYGLMTERNSNNNYYNNYGHPAKYTNANELQKLFRKNEFDIELLNSIKK